MITGDVLGPAYNFNQNSLTDVLEARDGRVLKPV
jgi:hypothetical protein